MLPLCSQSQRSHLNYVNSKRLKPTFDHKFQLKFVSSSYSQLCEEFLAQTSLKSELPLLSHLTLVTNYILVKYFLEIFFNQNQIGILAQIDIPLTAPSSHQRDESSLTTIMAASNPLLSLFFFNALTSDIDGQLLIFEIEIAVNHLVCSVILQSHIILV